MRLIGLFNMLLNSPFRSLASKTSASTQVFTRLRAILLSPYHVTESSASPADST
jgi:hypothetical protein